MTWECCVMCEGRDCLRCSGVKVRTYKDMTSEENDDESDQNLLYICKTCRPCLPTLRKINVQLEKVRIGQEETEKTLKSLESTQKENVVKLNNMDSKLTALKAGFDDKIKTVVQTEIQEKLDLEINSKFEASKTETESKIKTEEKE